MMQIFPLGDAAFQVKFGDVISPEILLRIRAYMELVEKAGLPGITELVPSYTDLIIHYQPLETEYGTLIRELKKLHRTIKINETSAAKTVRIPVLYGGSFGKDLPQVSQYAGMSEQQVIDMHCQTSYLVYMLGFTPGFCYLGGMNNAISTPRKEIPETKILAGSVGIAGEQTGIYPIESPGGWQIIGRTPLRLFDPQKAHPFLLEAGNLLEFYPIDKSEYSRLNEHHDG
ncbi:MAG: 5-oxoprolinase subunit PxpB [Carboxylicivirga sp.]|jgi:KipI family sensor histidine kinase inhibitor|nr:5-oxoprolinase subunit PxpB [Carboxylicivirga sp.]